MKRIALKNYIAKMTERFFWKLAKLPQNMIRSWFLLRVTPGPSPENPLTNLDELLQAATLLALGW